MSNEAYWKENYNAVVAERDKLAVEIERLNALLARQTRRGDSWRNVVAEWEKAIDKRDDMLCEKTAELEQYRQAEKDGRLQIINKALFCRNASKRDGKCAGYHENMFSHATLRMCAECGKYDPSADEADYYEDIGEDHEDNG